MSDPDARAKLAAEAERLKEERLAVERQAEVAKHRARADAEASVTALDEGRLRKSVGRWTTPALWVTVGAACLFAMVSFDAEAEDAPVWAPRLAVACLGLTGLVVAWRFAGPTRHRRWLASLPFGVKGLTELLGGGRAVDEVRVTLAFKDTSAPLEVLQELVRAKVPGVEGRAPRVLQQHDALHVHQDLPTESSNYPLHEWFHALATRVLCDVHRGYPLAHVGVTAVKHDEFYVPSGD